MAHPRRIGLDIGSVRTKAAQCDRRGQVERLASFPRENPHSPVDTHEAEHIAEVLMRQGFQPGPVVLACDPEHIRIEELELPPIADRPTADRIVASEIVRIAHWAPGTFEQSWWSVPPKTQHSATHSALVVASTHASAEALVQPIAATGFDVEALEIPAIAAVRACAANSSAKGMVCAVDIGWRSSELSARLDGELVFVRALPGSGISSLHEALGIDTDEKMTTIERLSSSSEKNPWSSPSLRRSFQAAIDTLGYTLADELNRSFAYISRRFQGCEPITTFVGGGGSSISGLAETIKSSLRVDITCATPGQLTPCPMIERRWRNDCALMTAIGLMLRGSS
jgi:Tfp pilus assembly PilM family ATPase